PADDWFAHVGRDHVPADDWSARVDLERAPVSRLRAPADDWSTHVDVERAPVRRSAPLSTIGPPLWSANAPARRVDQRRRRSGTSTISARMETTPARIM